MRVAAVVGNPRPKSRTLTIAQSLAVRFATAVGGATVDVIDLCDYARDIFRWPHDELAALALSVASADLAVFASPTYKASYTGLLKAFLDRYPNGGLTGLTAVPVMTGSDPIHGMAPEVALRPLLVELGASAPTRGLYFVMSQMGVVDQVLDEWVASNFTQLVRLVVSDGVDTTPSGS